MAGKRKKTHWSVRRKNKQAKLEEAKRDGVEMKPRADRRADFPESVHPGSYAAQYKAQKQQDNDVLKDNEKEESNGVIKRRFGLWVAFCGKDYSGMQMNEGVKTIEAEVERALFEVGAISETNYGFLQKIGWSRAARTDKGVHAAGQLITAKLLIKDELPVFLEKVNAFLPEDIRIMDIMSVTKNFNAKMSCDQRTYEYLAPTFIFQKREKRTLAEGEAKWPTDLDDVDKKEIVIDNTTLKAHMSYRMSDESWTYLDQVLKEYVGTHNFHNFTSKLEPKDPKCNRYITSFIAEKPFVENDMEWVRLRVIGQSFLLHHIRKMIGTAVEIVAGITDLDTINRGTQIEKMDLPKAPSVGLYLAKAHFKIYNVKLGNAINATHPPLDLNEEAMERVEKFKRDYIFKHIISHEKKTRTYSKWLQTLESLPFSYTTLPYDEWKAQKEKEALLQNRAEKRQFAAAGRAKQVTSQENEDNSNVEEE